MTPIHILLAVAIAAVWGFNFIAVHIALHDLSPVLLCAIRFVLTSLPAVFFVKRPAVPWKLLVSYALIMFALQFSLMFLGIRMGMTPGLASILLQTQAVFTMILATIIFKEKLSTLQICGAIISFSGIGLVAVNLGGTITLAGFMLIIASAVCWAVGSLLVKKMGPANQIGLVVWASLIAWPILLGVSLLLEGPTQIWESLTHVSKPSTISALYITYMSTCFGFMVWNWLLGRYPLSRVAPFTLLVPIFGMSGAAIMIGEPIYPWKVGSALLVISGLVLHQVSTNRSVKKLFQRNKDIV